SLLEAVRVRWNGTVLTEIDFIGAGVTGMKNYYLMRIDASSADTSRIADDMLAVEPNAHGEHRVSSQAAMKLLAAISEERTRGDVEVAANWIVTSASFQTRSAADSPTGYGADGWAWTPNIYQQPGFRRGDAQDIGVGEAWRAMEAAGRFSNKVKVVIMDGGFQPNDDVPLGTRIEPPTGWNRPNPSTCTGGSTCNWHGTGVAQIAFGALDNGFGAAGTAAPVADPILVPSPALDFLQILQFIFRGVPALVGGQRIVNISGGTGIGAGWYALTFGALDAIAAGLRLNNTLIVAAAGNDSQDVDDIDCLDIFGEIISCWEGTVWIPCELPGVVCVGGLQYDSANHDSGSNRHGADESANSVDIHAPYWNWIGPNPDDAASGPNSAQLIAGTSGASPFVAGVAALIWASKPSASAGEVERILYETAHPDVGPIIRRVNAYAAVREALGGNTAPFVQLLTPTAGSSFPRRRASVPLLLTMEDDNPSGVTVTWTSNIDGTIGTGTSTATTSLSAGTHTITATIVDGGVTQTRTTTVTIFNEDPFVEIVNPRTATYGAFEQQLVRFTARSNDLNELAAIPDADLTWHLGSPGGALLGSGHTATYTVPDGQTANFQVCAVAESSAGLVSNDCVTIDPSTEPDNMPPDVVITFPEENANFVVDGDGDADLVLS
ncbi:MAG TPA: S8/S53 family peptidase, partial [Myxococcota bacterium]|nr:S8/S53 family peptidase [Myxococcota bacterium]